MTNTEMIDNYNRTYLWEILVPVWSKGVMEDWKEKVISISKGLTVCKKVKGYWLDPDFVEDRIYYPKANQAVIKESMLPVRVACNREQMTQIATYTKEFFKQESLMYYRLSDEVNFI